MQESSRRDFIKTAGLGVTGLGMLDLQDVYPPLTPLVTKPRKVELAIATITCDGFGDMNFEPAFAMIPRLPYKNVEFNCWYARNLTPMGIQSIKDRCRQHKLKPICVQGSSFGASGNIIKDVTHKLWNMEAARQLGCNRVKFTGAGRGSEGGLDAIIKTLKELAPAAEEMGMLILVENHANNNLENIEDYDRLFSAIASPNVGMCMDNAHFDGANVDLYEVVDRFHSRILHIDLKDTERKGIHKVVRYGEGVTDNAGVVERMLAHGYTGYLLIEMAPPQNQQTLEEDLRKAYHLFQKYER
ncbi:sugar phosphate isomerase/epimerase family protein [Telluribacter humicola]|uniref:sugar phosphate isomerase/epimerase family protein n=1 Tax=Telluribacter humicola TaxID=1720261 RepID=UPI001E424F22|nr:sugar phosphate isomerase/epimerase family protein [Telluribacter humicola]